MGKSIWILYCLVIALHSITVTATITCHVGSHVISEREPSDDTEEYQTCGFIPGTAGCRILLRSSNVIEEHCLNFASNCDDPTLQVGAPGEVIQYQICCKTNLCNDQATFLSAIVDYESSLMANTTTVVTTTSIQPTTTITVASTSTSRYTSTSSFLSSSRYTSTTSSLSSVSTSSTSPLSSTTTTLMPDDTERSRGVPGATGTTVIIVVCVLVVTVFLLTIIIAVGMFFHFHQKNSMGIPVPMESDGTPTISTSGEFSNDLNNESTTSGSGSGLPLLIQRSVAAQVTLHNLVGKGRFGEVWRGSYRGDDIAVKKFHTKEEASWFHEVDIYQTCLIRHPNILRFVAADNKDIGMATELWLITEYCELGSLYELLQNKELDESIMLKLLCTSAAGLAHLHAEITGTEGKPGIAHRDLKTRNILVKSDYTCCLADLGLALRYDKAADKIEELSTKRVGTRRYLSPEILDDSMDTRNFDCFKRSDMYSFGLVMWEVTRRGLCAGHAEEYQLPYFELLSPDPSFEEVKRVVADEQNRPGIPNRWSQSEIFNSLTRTMEECWHNNSEARLTALRVKKNLATLQSSQGKMKAGKIDSL